MHGAQQGEAAAAERDPLGQIPLVAMPLRSMQRGFARSALYSKI
jgi:hypothetical protein